MSGRTRSIWCLEVRTPDPLCPNVGVQTPGLCKHCEYGHNLQTQILRGSDMLSLRKPISATLQTQRDPGAAQRPGPRGRTVAGTPGLRSGRDPGTPGPRSGWDPGTPGPRSGRDTGTNQEHNHWLVALQKRYGNILSLIIT